MMLDYKAEMESGRWNDLEKNSSANWEEVKMSKKARHYRCV